MLKNITIAHIVGLKWTRRKIMKNKVRRNLKKNKFNWRKNIYKRGVKEWLKNPPPLEIHVDPNFLGMPNGVPNQEPFGMPFGQPFGVQIQNGDKWEPLIPIGIWGKKG
jgi:hypothetical protein